MPPHELVIRTIIPLGITIGIAGWALIAKWYVWPWLSKFAKSDALIILLFPHVFRYLGLTFLVPGVTHVPLNPGFADPTAYGDLATTMLALVSILLLRSNSRFALPLVWLMTVVGMGDLLSAFPTGLLLQAAGDFGAVIFVALAFVPLLMVSHILIIIKLLQRSPANARS
jgi:hypothetical protein